MLLSHALRLGQESARPDVVTVVGGGGKTSLVFQLARELSEQDVRVVSATTTRVAAYQMERAPSRLVLSGDTIPFDELARALDEHGHCLVVGQEQLLRGKQTGVTPAVIDAIAEAASRLGIGAILVEGDGSRTLPVKAPGDHEPVIPQSTTLVVPCMGMDALGLPLEEGRVHRPERIRSVLDLPDGPARLTPSMAARLLLHPLGGSKSLPAHARLVPMLNKAETAPRLAGARLIAATLSARSTPSIITALAAEEREPVLERWGPVAVIILAAGSSSRFDAPKQAVTVEGEPMVRRAVRVAAAAGVDHMLLVTGAHASETIAALGSSISTPRLAIVHADRWMDGQSASLRAGLHALPSTVEAVICMPVDQPWLDDSLLRRLVAAWRAGSPLAAPLADGELRGAPALFDRSLFAHLEAVTGDQGGRSVLAAHADRAAALPVAATMVRDIDRPSQLEDTVG